MEFKAGINSKEMDKLRDVVEAKIAEMVEECTIEDGDDREDVTIDKPSRTDIERAARDLVYEILGILGIDHR